MSFPKIVLFGSIAVFGLIGFMGMMKNAKNKEIAATTQGVETVQEVVIEDEMDTIPVAVVQEESQEEITGPVLPDGDNIDRLFATGSNKLSVVETITYTSRVPWLKGRPAWIADYASYYETSRHFIARSLNRKPDYFTQKVAPGDRFNVLKKDRNVNFHLLIDLSRLKLWFYCIDQSTNERILLKTYSVGLGRKDSKRVSGCLTPVGKYLLGSKIALYKPGSMGYFQERKTEMIRVFGTRWLPFEKEISDCSEGAKGYGLHGAPWSNDPVTGQFVEETDKIGTYDTDGCVRLLAKDMEEIFSIVVTKPTVVELVNDFYEAKLPGVEKEKP